MKSPLPSCHKREMVDDRRQLVVVDLHRRYQGDVRRDRQREGIAKRLAPFGEFGTERLGNRDRNADRVGSTAQESSALPGGDGRNPTRSRTNSIVATATPRARSAPAARIAS